MTYKIHITKKAENDLEGAADYIEFNLLNPKAADDLLDEAERKIYDLAPSPKMYPTVDDPVLKAWEIRFVPVDNYLAFYIIKENTKTVHLIRFLYGKRNWINLLKLSPPDIS